MLGEPHIDNLITASRTQALTRAEIWSAVKDYIIGAKPYAPA